MFRVSMGSWVMLMFVSILMVSSTLEVEGIGSDEKCDEIVISNTELRNNVTRTLYGLERDLKILIMENELVNYTQMFDEVPLILHNFLLSKYEEAEESLNSLIFYLSKYSATNFTNSDYIPESMVDFSKRAIISSKHAQILIEKLIHCNKTSKFTNPKLINSSNSSENSGCVVDGTKCQFSHCAKGNKLGICSVGFAIGVTGGASGPYYIVTRSDDNDPENPAPGTLRHAVNFGGKNKGGVWIVFRRSMEIKLKEKLWIKSDTTIDGRGVNITIFGEGLVLGQAENIILHNFEVVSTGKSDTIHVFDGTQRVWIDHITSRDAYLGLVTVLQGSTDVTISNCYLSNHNFNMLLGASDQDTIDQILRVTVYRNWFESSNQRMPHCRWGYCHVVNNYYRDWNYYAIGGRVHAKILSELNVFEPGNRLEVTPWHDQFTSDLTPTIESSHDLLLKGATFHQFLTYGTLSEPETEYPAYKLPTRQTDSLANLVINCSGVLFGHKLKRCMETR